MQNKGAFEVSLWKSKDKYEFRVSRKNREIYFDKSKNSFFLKLPNHVKIEITLNPSFWNKCSHFDDVDGVVKKWLYDNGHIPYKKGKPPKFVLEKLDEDNYEMLV